MQDSFKQLSSKIGKMPGHLQFVGMQRQANIEMSVMAYQPNVGKYLERVEVTDIKKNWQPEETVWLNIDGVHDANLVEVVGKQFEIDALVLEDVLNTTHLPKFEDVDKYLFLTLKMLYVNDAKTRIEQEHLSFLLLDKSVISFQERKGDVFEPIRERILQGRGKVRTKAADYLFYLLLDAVVDNYYLVLQYLEEQTLSFETKLLKDVPATLEEILQLKKQLIELRKMIFPLSDMLTKIIEAESTLIQENSLKYFRDVKDHILHVTENLKDLREMTNGLIDLYMMNASNQLNHVMKTLTIVATIFIPLTFVAGIYGMNFDFMPELHWRYGYFFAWGVMFFVLVVMLWFMRRKNWV
ncbi:MAG: magnesium/cobalt transporter CorA [Chitinophagales bacterium]